MQYLLTSSLMNYTTMRVRSENHLIDILHNEIPLHARIVFLASAPAEHAKTLHYSEEIYNALLQENLSLSSSYSILDDENVEIAGKLMDSADVVIALGGHVLTQNEFFSRIGLKKLLADFDGLYIGSSAGSMNACKIVYAQPEKPGEAFDTHYTRFLHGLGITKKTVIPHYDKWCYKRLDGINLMFDITIPDSYGRTFYLLNDGSFLYGNSLGGEEIHGNYTILRNGVVEE